MEENGSVDGETANRNWDSVRLSSTPITNSVGGMVGFYIRPKGP